MGGLDIDYEMNSPQPLSKKVSEMSLNSVSFSFGAANFSLDQNENFGASSATASLCEFFSSPYSVELENDVVRTTSHLVHDLSNLNYIMFGNGSISDMANSFGQSQIANIECLLSSCIPNKTGRGHLNLEPIEDFSDILKEDDKIPKVEHRICANFYSKSAEENSQNQAPKENYIHVRARRGQATNSHSLAERVRREKIGERMKFLQELVPGCSKITGKAVMLDEIINYVQSLQQQVEFLSMKLANVAPELNLPTEQIVIADIIHSQGMDDVFAIDPRPTTSQTTPQAMFQFYGTMPRTHQ